MSDFTITGGPELDKRIEKLTNPDRQKILEEIAYNIVNADIHEDFFPNQHAPDGGAWTPLKESTVKRRKGHTRTILQDTGKLKASVQVISVTPELAVVGVVSADSKSEVKAMVHNFGIGRPQRQFLGIRPDALDRALKVILKYLNVQNK